jgi:uncharacterized Rmd1/YagE family protein
MDAISQRIAELEERLKQAEKTIRAYEPVIIHFSKQNLLQWFILLLAMTSIIMQLIK